jgi:hypothetical protein
MLARGALVVEDLQMTYQTAEGPVRGVSFTVKPGEFYTLLGASGCGKTTVLRCIAGLESPDCGRIAIGEQLVYSGADHLAEPPHRRDIGMVFQSYAIWLHLNVFDNVSFPLVAGAGRVATFVKINLRVVLPALLNGWLWVVAHAVRDFTVPLFLANLIWGEWELGSMPVASAYMVVLMAIVVVLVFVGRGRLGAGHE